jgi:hypothetical protein
LKPLEERYEAPKFGENSKGSFAKSVFVSEQPRDPFKASANPPPNNYHPVDDPKYMVRGRIQNKFGADAARDSFLHRDIERSPFKNRSSFHEKVGPGSYRTKDTFLQMSKDDSLITAAGMVQSGTNVYSSAYQ